MIKSCDLLLRIIGYHCYCLKFILATLRLYPLAVEYGHTCRSVVKLYVLTLAIMMHEDFAKFAPVIGHGQ